MADDTSEQDIDFNDDRVMDEASRHELADAIVRSSRESDSM
jgi:hypothetical protein